MTTSNAPADATNEALESAKEYLVQRPFRIEQQEITQGEVITDIEVSPSILAGLIARGWVVDLSTIEMVDVEDETEGDTNEDLLVTEIGLTDSILSKVQAAGLSTRSQLIDFLESGNLDSLELKANQVESLKKSLAETQQKQTEGDTNTPPGE